MDKKILTGLGLTNNEVEVYISMLRLGSATANTIASKSGLHKQAVYDALERLIEKGFAAFVVKNNKKHFNAAHPSKIMDFLDEKKKGVESILPELVRITREEKEDTAVEVFKGKKVVRVYFREHLRELERQGGDSLVYGINDKLFYEADKIAIEQYLANLRRKGLHEKVLVEKGEKFFLTGRQTSYRQLPKEFFSSIPISVSGNKVLILIWGKPNHLIVIENKKLAEAIKKQFKLLWRTAKPVKKR